VRLERRIVRGSTATACSTDRLVDGAVCAVARAVASAVRRMPSGVPDGLRYRFGGWFDASPAACPTARFYRFGGWFATLR